MTFRKGSAITDMALFDYFKFSKMCILVPYVEY
jgi:hypothetical protein